MSIINILNIQVLDNPTRYSNPFQFEITFECTAALQDDLEWKVIYVGSAEDEQYDQTLDCIMVGPVPVGVNKFVYQADAPNSATIPPGDVMGVTVVLITCGYRGQEFVRVGYYVNNEYEEEELRTNPPALPIIEKLQRNILADKPRVTRFPIKWDNVDELEAPAETLLDDLADFNGLEGDLDGNTDADTDADADINADADADADDDATLSEDADMIEGSSDGPEHQKIAPLEPVKVSDQLADRPPALMELN